MSVGSRRAHQHREAPFLPARAAAATACSGGSSSETNSRSVGSHQHVGADHRPADGVVLAGRRPGVLFCTATVSRAQPVVALWHPIATAARQRLTPASHDPADGCAGAVHYSSTSSSAGLSTTVSTRPAPPANTRDRRRSPARPPPPSSAADRRRRAAPPTGTCRRPRRAPAPRGSALAGTRRCTVTVLTVEEACRARRHCIAMSRLLTEAVGRRPRRTQHPELPPRLVLRELAR